METIQYTQEECAFKLFAEMQKAAVAHKNYGHQNIKLELEIMGLEISVSFKERKRAVVDEKQLENVLAYSLGHSVRLTPAQFKEVYTRMRKELGL